MLNIWYTIGSWRRKERENRDGKKLFQILIFNILIKKWNLGGGKVEFEM